MNFIFFLFASLDFSNLTLFFFFCFFKIKYHGNGTYTQGTGHKIEGKWSMGQMEGTAKVESSTWTVTKTGFTVPIADMVVNFEPLVEFPRQILLRF